MNKSTLTAGAAITLALITAGAAMAQSADRPGRGARADADNDGRVSRAEFVQGRIAHLTAIDANRDGSVSAEERQSGIDTRRNQRASARFEALDKDGNGSISREEFTAREPRGDRAERHGGPGMRQGGHRGPRGGWGRGGRGQGGDRGPNGEARGPLSIAEVQARLTTRFDRLDANSDGYITAEERAAARQSMREDRRERRAERMARRAAGQPSPSGPASE